MDHFFTLSIKHYKKATAKAFHPLPSAISGVIVHATETVLRYKPGSIPRVNWDHRNWVHQRAVGLVYHGWVGIVRWQC